MNKFHLTIYDQLYSPEGSRTEKKHTHTHKLN